MIPMFHGQNRLKSFGYGRLYNWYAVNTGILAPLGWHIPTYDEWEELGIFLGGMDIAGDHLKIAGTTYWKPTNIGSDNSSNFYAKPSGIRSDTTGEFYYSTSRGYWWSTTIEDVSYIFTVGLYQGYNLLDKSHATHKIGDAIRFIKDSTILSNGETSIMTDNDGNIINTTCIGTQEWTSENCKHTKYNNGSIIPFFGVNGINFSNGEWASLTTPGVCAYNNDESYV